MHPRNLTRDNARLRLVALGYQGMKDMIDNNNELQVEDIQRMGKTKLTRLATLMLDVNLDEAEHALLDLQWALSLAEARETMTAKEYHESIQLSIDKEGRSVELTTALLASDEALNKTYGLLSD